MKFKQIIGIIFLGAFLVYLGNKFYKETTGSDPLAALFFGLVVLIIIGLVLRKILRG